MLHLAVRQLTSVMVYDILSPPQAGRAYAYASVAAYEAMRVGNPQYQSLAGQVRGLTAVPVPPSAEISAPLAGVHAYLAVGRALTFSRTRMDSLRLGVDERFRRRPGMTAEVFARSVAYGDTVAKHILAWAGTDGYLQTRGGAKYTVTNTPGRWVPTPPAYMDAVEPNWNKIRPFTMDSASAFRPESPFPYDTAKASDFMRQATEVYETGKRLTDAQRNIAAFWDCNPYVMHVQGHTMFATKKVTPGGHWMGIVGTAARKTNADALRSAEAYARTALALADGFMSAWDEKYRSGVVRPETVINAYLDEGWEPLLQTPPFPEYPSGHSVISTAAAQVLTDQFGPNFAFVDSTEMDYGIPPRAFESFEQAAAEAAISRLYGGIHYRQAIEQGIVEGRRVGQHVLTRVHTRAGAQVADARNDRVRGH
jgi:membrane-associated phospholipid phosphatase